MEELVMESGPLDPLTIEQDGVIGAGEAIALATSQSLLVRMVTFGCEFAMIVGGVVPYVPQYISIRSSGNTKGFSLYVCLALITANILRILFWFGRHYEIPLLIQSILMNIAMFALIHLCVHVNSQDRIAGQYKEHVFTDFEAEHFWQWTDFQSFIECTVCFVAVGSFVMYLLLKYDPFVETVGFLAVFTEAMLGTPQFYRNFTNKSTYGMSLQMVLMWTCGDVFKTTYFYLRKTPPQFVICGCLQVMVDVAILTQVWLYYENTAKRKKTQINMHFWQEDDYESGHDFENATSLIIESSAETDTDFSDTDPLLLTAS